MSAKARQIIARHAEEGLRLRKDFFAAQAKNLEDCARCIALAVARGHKLLICGNGGSAADAQHLAAEFVNRFLLDRPPLPAIALTTDSSVLTAISNDFGFEHAFAKQIHALGAPGDVLLAISTSGKSPNVLAALRAAREKNMHTIGLSGAGHDMDAFCDIALHVPHASTPLIQEVHIAAGHLVCALVEYFLFKDVMTILPGLHGDAAPES
ncbi:MAG: D-sedoheptulose 7-phosphate isomerase [Deltaproteobacteria bacterium]|nr:D-sedoheptulose 7-phosphate isomerase [Deltaproteobacteria bacterium]